MTDDIEMDWAEELPPEGMDSETQSESESRDEPPDDSSEDEEVPSNVPDTNAEQEIEGDFDRLVKNIRLQDSSTANLLTKEWDFNIAEKDAEFKDDLRAASGIGRTRNKTGRRTGPALSLQVKSLIGDGNQAYIDNNLPDAIRIMQEVIRIERS